MGNKSSIPTIADSVEGERLDIADVINGTAELSENIMYATLIDPSAINRQIATLQNLFTAESCGAKVTEYVDTMEAYLANTNSQQFYSGDAATKNRENMELVKANVAIISGEVNKLDPSAITSLANEYNEKLADLKKDVRRNLLEKAANEFNAKKEEWNNFPVKKTYTRIEVSKPGLFNDKDYWVDGVGSPEQDPAFNKLKEDDSQTELYAMTRDDIKVSTSESTDENGVTTVTKTTRVYYTVHKYKKITCNYGFEKLVMWWDPSFEEIEAQFDKVGCALPYNRENVQLQAHKDSSFLGISWNSNFGD